MGTRATGYPVHQAGRHYRGRNGFEGDGRQVLPAAWDEANGILAHGSRDPDIGYRAAQ